MGLLDAAVGGSLGTLFIKLQADSIDLVRGMDQAVVSVEKSCAVIVRVAAAAGAALAATFSIIGVAAVREFSKFEDSFAGVRKTIDASEAEFQKLSDAFRNMAKEIPVNVNAINAVAEAAGQLGIAKENIIGFTRVMIDLGNTTNMTADQAATSLAQFANITQMAQKDFDRLGSTVVALGNKGASTEKQIVDMGLRLAGAGTQVGMTESQILSFASALSSVGIEAEAGGSAMSKTIMDMGKAVATGSTDLALFAKVAGQTADQFKIAFSENAAGAVIAFLGGLKKMKDEGKDVFTTLDKLGVEGIRQADALLRASGAGTLFADALKEGAKAWSDNTAAAEEARKRYETFSSQITITGNLLRDMLITIGELLAPHLLKLNEALQSAMKSTDGFGNSMKNIIDNVIPALITGAGMVGDAIWGWRLLIKSGELSFLMYAEAVLGIFTTLAHGIAAIYETIINGIITGLNLAIEKMNKVLPQALKVSQIDWKLEIPLEPLDRWTQAFGDARQEAESELNKMTAEGSFTDRLIGDTKSLNDGVIKADLNKFFEETVPEAQAKLSKNTLNPIAMATNAANSQLDAMKMPKHSRGLHGLDDPTTNQFLDIQMEKDNAELMLKQLDEINKQELSLDEEHQKKKLALLEAYHARQKALQSAQVQLILGTTSRMFDDLAGIAEAFGGRQAAMFKAMFAVSKAFAIAESIVKIQQGIASAAALPWPANLAAMASVVAATASIVSNIQAVKLEFGGKREKGGPVDTGSAFLVGEKGPEMFVPNSNGKIIPNNQLRGGDSKPVSVTVNNYSDNRVEVREKDENGQRSLEVMVHRIKNEIGAEIKEGRGPVTKALETSFRLRRGNT